MRPLALLLLLATATSASAADDIMALLKQDVVTIANGKLSIQSYSLCTVNNPQATKKSFQVGGHSEEPIGGPMSRDNFVAFDSAARTAAANKLGTKFGPAGAGAAPAIACKPISAPIGTVDFELNFYMTNDGVQVEVKDNNAGTTKREVLTWDALFPK